MSSFCRRDLESSTHLMLQVGRFRAFIAFEFCASCSVLPWNDWPFLQLHWRTWWKVMVALPGIFVCVTTAIPNLTHMFIIVTMTTELPNVVVMADFSHHFTWIQPCVWQPSNSAHNSKKNEVRKRVPPLKYLNILCSLFFFESSAASFQAGSVRVKRKNHWTAVVPVHPAIVGYLYHCFYWRDIERLK